MLTQDGRAGELIKIGTKIARFGSVAEIIEPPSDLVLACGMSVGYADPAVPRPVMPRAQLSDVVTFVADTALGVQT